MAEAQESKEEKCHIAFTGFPKDAETIEITTLVSEYMYDNVKGYETEVLGVQDKNEQRRVGVRFKQEDQSKVQERLEQEQHKFLYKGQPLMIVTIGEDEAKEYVSPLARNDDDQEADAKDNESADEIKPKECLITDARDYQGLLGSLRVFPRSLLSLGSR